MERNSEVALKWNWLLHFEEGGFQKMLSFIAVKGNIEYVALNLIY